MWQNLPYHIDPVLINLGPLSIRYYGLMYCIAFFITYYLSLFRIKKENFPLEVKSLDNFLTYGLAGILIGARVGYFLFYYPSAFVSDPLSIFIPLEFGDRITFTGFSGMSFHGGLIGAIIASVLFSRRNRVNLLDLGDLVVPIFPLGYMFGRLGNFFNSELYGRATDSVLGMYFPTDPLHVLRHPSQLYEAFGEGLLLFIIFWTFRNRKILHRRFIALYLIGYGAVRFIVEFFREPDLHIGFVLGPFSLGQLLCMAMIIGGISFFFAVSFFYTEDKGVNQDQPEDHS